MGNAAKKTSEKVGAKCPKCGKRWLWDSCQDMYQDLDGKYCESHIMCPDDDDEYYHYFCTCGEWLTTLSDGDYSSHAEGFDLEWDLDENSVYPC